MSESFAGRILPGLLLCLAVTAGAVALARVETALFGRDWLEPLVLAILLGTAVRTVWAPGPRWRPGVGFCGRTLLEVAVVLLGASVSIATIMAAGPLLLAGITVVVAVAITASYAIGRALGLTRRLAVLVACGNSICGNSAIAAVAPVIGAGAEDIASSIAFTAVLGVVVVLIMPPLVSVLGLSVAQAGVLAGLTVYAVPQVLAATVPIGALAVQVGTLVKLVRVLMLGPVVLVLSLVARQRRAAAAAPGAAKPALSLHRLLPWFIVGFLALAVLRSAGLVPGVAVAPVAWAANAFTVLAMAALGLGVDVRVVAQAGGRVTAAVVLSLLTLGCISLVLIFVTSGS
jgi:uncharacterized integral membrane protein (TIGR00698 family)